MGKKGRTEGGTTGGVRGAGGRSYVGSGGGGRSGAHAGRTNESPARPVAWWPFWGAFLLVAAVVGVAVGHGELQMRNLRTSIDALHEQMSTLTTNLGATEDQFSDLVSQAELRLASTVQDAVSRRARDVLGPARGGGSGDAETGTAGGDRMPSGEGGGGSDGTSRDRLTVPVLADGVADGELNGGTTDRMNGGADSRANAGVYVRVRPGDSLWEISRALWGRGSLYPTLARENELDPAAPLLVDTLLRVPTDGRADGR